MAATRDARGTMSVAQTVDPSGAVAVAIAMSPQGEAVLRWGSRAAVRPPGGVFGSPITLAPEGVDATVDMAYRQLAVDRRGRAVIAFERTAAVRPALGVFSAPLAIPGSRQLVAAGAKITTLWVAGGAVKLSDLPS